MQPTMGETEDQNSGCQKSVGVDKNKVAFSLRGDAESLDGHSSINSHRLREKQLSSRILTFKKRASQVILEIPVSNIRKVQRHYQNVSSIDREAKHFSDITTLHGPKRIYYGKRLSTYFWIIVTIAATILLSWQIYSLVDMYLEKPTVSKVSFLINGEGLEFPIVTICNYNEIKRSYVEKLNKTGNFPVEILDYALQMNVDPYVLTTDKQTLHMEHTEYEEYRKNYPDFNLTNFIDKAGFECAEMFRMCSFAGRNFNCCNYTSPVLTNFGKCYALDVGRSKKQWMIKQTTAGADAGLQIILDAHSNEQLVQGSSATAYYENGFRYYIHANNTLAYLNSEGISVSPGFRAYSAISSNRYVLLTEAEWGNCTKEWPANYSTILPYSFVNCAHLCKARFFNEKCGCAPALYNIDHQFTICTPKETADCTSKMAKDGDIDAPGCKECKPECESLVYHAYNSYGQGFTNSAYRYLRANKNIGWNKTYAQYNGVTINVFFRDMSHTEYQQARATTLTQILSDMGGNMGLFLGMSVFSIAELSLFLTKVSWLIVSKKRRDYMYKKKKTEEEREKELEEAVSDYRVFRRRRKHTSSLRMLKQKVKSLAGNLYNRENAKIAKKKANTMNGPRVARSQTIGGTSDCNYYLCDKPSTFTGRRMSCSIVELTVNTQELENTLEQWKCRKTEQKLQSTVIKIDDAIC